MTIVVLRPELYFAEITETTDTLSPLIVISLVHQIVNKHTKAETENSAVGKSLERNPTKLISISTERRREKEKNLSI